MANECHRFNHQSLHLNPRTTFLPRLCSRTSIKDVVLPRWEDRSEVFSDDPLSPKIGCMGQVKRNNKVVGFPSSQKLSLGPKHSANNNINNNNHSAVKYSKLKRLFSGKNLASTTFATTTPAASTGRFGSRRQVTGNGAIEAKTCHIRENCESISVVDMDPPLPVTKLVRKPEGGEADSLWKRRSGGAALKTLQLQQIHHPRQHLQVTSV